MHWNLLNDEEFGSLKFLKLKYRRGDQRIQPFWRIGSPKKLGPPSLIWENFKKLTKVLLNHVECIEIYWMTINLGPSNFSNWNTEGGPNNSAVLQNWFPQEIRSPSLIWENFKKLTKVLLNHVECIEIYWMTKNLGPSNFSNWNTEVGTK